MVKFLVYQMYGEVIDLSDRQLKNIHIIVFIDKAMNILRYCNQFVLSETMREIVMYVKLIDLIR